MRTFKVDSRTVLGTSVVFAAVLGCSTQITVVDPPSPNLTGPNQPVTPQALQFNGATHQALTAPPPISGGTLLTTTMSDGSPIAVVADPEEDAIDVVSLGTSPALVGRLDLQAGDQPGRMVADGSGRVHVVLRGGGGIATIVPTATGPVLASRRATCSAPRGIDYSGANDSVYVVCATGEIVVLPAAGGAVTATADLGRDLRDIVVTPTALYVSRFRTANVVVVDPVSLGITNTLAAPGNIDTQPDALWRLTKEPTGKLRIVYQLASTTPINVATPPGESSYGGNTTFNGPAGGVVTVASAEIDPANNSIAGPETLASNPVVDMAVGPDDQWEAISVLGNVETAGQQITTMGQDVQTAIANDTPDTYVAIADARSAANPAVVLQRRGQNPGLVVVHVSHASNSLIFTDSVAVALPQKTSHVDTGFDIFSIPTAAGVACMNCHPEGGDDSHTWQFQMADNSTRIRRTQALRGGVIAGSAPYHWDGDMANMKMLCDEVFTHRMGGGTVASTQELILTRFLDSMPRVPVKATLDPLRIAAGKTIFEGKGGCGGCHVGGTGTLPVNQDVGKTDFNGGAPLQVPMLLGVADRAPYMHDGCAATLMERLQVNECAGNHHGNVDQLSSDDKTNLIEYLQSL